MSDSTRRTLPVGQVLWEELLTEVITPIYFLMHTLLKDKSMGSQESGRVEIVSHSSCRTSAILKFFCLLACDLHLYWFVVQVGGL